MIHERRWLVKAGKTTGRRRHRWSAPPGRPFAGIGRRGSQEDGRHKPSSVVAPRGGGPGSFIWDPDCSEPQAAYPGLGRDRQPLVPYLALLRVGFAVRPLLPAARCALTAPFHPCLCPAGPSAVCSLWHFPSPRDARALPGTLPCGARTFLRPASPADSRRRSLSPSSWSPMMAPTGFRWPVPAGSRRPAGQGPLAGPAPVRSENHV